MDNFYVYRHIRLDTGETFYIGKGSKNRAWHKSGRNEYWHRVNKKHGYKIEILEYFNIEKLALSRELELITYYKSINQCKGNFNYGGTGLTGMKHSKESLKKISEKSKGPNNPMYGLKRPHSEENIKKMRGENHPFSKQVIDIITKIVYPSVGEAARQLGYKAPTLAAMLNGWRTNKTSLMYVEKHNGIST